MSATTTPNFEAPDWVDLDASQAGGRTFHDFEGDEGEWEGWVSWRSRNHSPAPLAIARLERLDTDRPAEGGKEEGEPAGELSLARTPMELLYIDTPAEARAIAVAAAALAVAMEAAGVGVEPGASS